MKNEIIIYFSHSSFRLTEFVSACSSFFSLFPRNKPLYPKLFVSLHEFCFLA